MRGSDEFKVFISYAWTSEAHKQWVLDLAERLMADGVYVILDVWDLKPGHDKYAFMEQMVTDPAVKKALVICDAGYQARADDRAGGVGAETQLISPEVYEKVDQEKFIPIVKERDQNGNPTMPRFIGSRVYIDLSAEHGFEQEYQRLLRNIFDQPEHPRPPLGEPPAHILEPSVYAPEGRGAAAPCRQRGGCRRCPRVGVSRTVSGGSSRCSVGDRSRGRA